MKKYWIMMACLALTACGEPVLNTQQVVLSGEEASLSPGSKGPQELSGQLRGLFSGENTPHPLKTARIQLTLQGQTHPLELSTNDLGRFDLPANLADGRYTLEASFEWQGFTYHHRFPDLDILQGLPQSSLALLTGTQTLTGQVALTDHVFSQDIQVSLKDTPFQAQSDTTGHFSIKNVPLQLPPDSQLEIHKPRYQSTTVPVSSGTPGEIQTLMLQPLDPLVPFDSQTRLTTFAGRLVIQSDLSDTLNQTDQGKPIGDFQDGSLNEARFDRPSAMILDATGHLIVADTHNHRLRRISPEGQVSTLAGEGPGLENGPNHSARFQAPQGLALGPDQHLYIADTGNHQIRKLDANSQVTTYLGSEAGYQDGDISSARFESPTDMGFDAKGNLYVLDLGNRAIRKISPSGDVRTVFQSHWNPQGFFRKQKNQALQPLFFDDLSDLASLRERRLPLTKLLPPEPESLIFPGFMTVLPDGTLYVSDLASFMVFEITPAGDVKHFAGNGLREDFETPQLKQVFFDNPGPLTAGPDGAIYLADSYGVYRLKQGEPVEKLMNVAPHYAGTASQAPLFSRHLFQPTSLLYQPDGQLLVADHYLHQLQAIWLCEEAQAKTPCREAPPYFSALPPIPTISLDGRQFYSLKTAPFPTIPSDTPIEAPIMQPLRLTITNRSAQNLSLDPGFVATTYYPQLELFFSEGEPDRLQGLEPYAEDGIKALLSQNFTFGQSNLLLEVAGIPLGSTKPQTLKPGQTYQMLLFTGAHLHLLFKIHESNDLVLATPPQGIALNALPASTAATDITEQLAVWDVGTEVNEPLGSGPHQPDNQRQPNSGAAENQPVRRYAELSARDLVEVTVSPISEAEINRLPSSRSDGWDVPHP